MYIVNRLHLPNIYTQCVLLIKALSNSSKIILFMDILTTILSSTIRFVQTQSLPLIPLSCFIQHNLFRASCSELCRHYGVEWKLYERKKYKTSSTPMGQGRDKSRAKNYCDAFLHKLEEIKQKLLQNPMAVLPVFGSSLPSPLVAGYVLILCHCVQTSP